MALEVEARLPLVRRALLPILAVVLLATGCGDSDRRPAQFGGLDRTNIVLVLTDDLSTDLLSTCPSRRRCSERASSFDRFIVANSLCCPSRASILTGLLPHNTQVFTNSPPPAASRRSTHGNESGRSPSWLRDRGYRTALYGKYLNGYGAGNGRVPAGWTDWAATARAYQGFDYTLNVNGQPRQYGRTSGLHDGRDRPDGRDVHRQGARRPERRSSSSSRPSRRICRPCRLRVTSGSSPTAGAAHQRVQPAGVRCAALARRTAPARAGGRPIDRRALPQADPLGHLHR